MMFSTFRLKDFSMLCANTIQPLSHLIFNTEVNRIQQMCQSGGTRFLMQKIMRENSALIYAKLQPPSASLLKTLFTEYSYKVKKKGLSLFESFWTYTGLLKNICFSIHT